MKNSLKLITILCFTAVLTTACSHKDKNAAGPEMTVDVAEVTADSVMLHNDYPGYLKADKTVDVVARVNGTLMSKNYTDGQLVSRGQVLFTIESTRYADAVNQASAQLATARSQYEYASSHYAAVRRALESNAVSQMEVSQAQSAMEQAEAAIKAAEAELTTARTNLGYCTVRAPSSGRITDAKADVGAYVGGEGMPVVLATIYDDSSLAAVFSIEDAEYQQMVSRLGTNPSPQFTTVSLEFEQPLPHNYIGRLSYLSPDVNTSTGTLKMKAKVENPYGELRDGMFVTVSVPTGFDPHAMMVKDASLGTDQLGRYLYIVNDSNKVVYTPVKVGELVADTMRIVSSGVKPGDRYVTKALLKVRNGMPVKPRLVR